MVPLTNVDFGAWPGQSRLGHSSACIKNPSTDIFHPTAKYRQCQRKRIRKILNTHWRRPLQHSPRISHNIGLVTWNGPSYPWLGSRFKPSKTFNCSFHDWNTYIPIWIPSNACVLISLGKWDHSQANIVVAGYGISIGRKTDVPAPHTSQTSVIVLETRLTFRQISGRELVRRQMILIINTALFVAG